MNPAVAIACSTRSRASGEGSSRSMGLLMPHFSAMAKTVVLIALAHGGDVLLADLPGTDPL